MNDQWYTAKCLYISTHTGTEPAYEELSEYRYFLVKAFDDLEAMKKATDLAKMREHSYQNQFGATIQWKLDHVLAVKEITNFVLKEGLEIYHEYATREQVAADQQSEPTV